MTWAQDAIVTSEKAAAIVDRPASTIRRWAHEGRFRPVGYVGRTPYYRESDILKVDAQLARP